MPGKSDTEALRIDADEHGEIIIETGETAFRFVSTENATWLEETDG